MEQPITTQKELAKSLNAPKHPENMLNPAKANNETIQARGTLPAPNQTNLINQHKYKSEQS